MQEDRIIQQVLDGDTEAFRWIVDRYQGPVWHMIRHLTGPDVSDDIAQDVFVSAFAKLASYDPGQSRFSTWLFTIARNKAINAMKKKRPIYVSELPERPCQGNPSDDAVHKELLEQLDLEVEKLPPRQRRVLVLADFQGLPYDEIAQIEGVRLGTVKSRINRARAKLRAVLTRIGGPYAS
jgi:RNA polymerase sigma-70 factor, ECF subfamily